MASSATAPGLFLDVFRARAGPGGTLTFADFMALALYDPRAGYYRADRPRVGHGPGTDFQTAASLGSLFGELTLAAVTTLLGGPAAARQNMLVEIGAEPGGGMWPANVQPLAGVRSIRLGETLALRGAAVVFSNELFDAQPLRRFVRRGRAWRELGVAPRGSGFALVELGEVAVDWLPAEAPEGYHFDAPRAAAELAGAIAAQPWEGLFLAFDYGKSWRELATATPAGTVRAYHRHVQSNDLLARPGDQDLTGHVCWDWIAQALMDRGFSTPTVESQETFFVRHAAAFIEATITAEVAKPSARKRALLQLLHPAGFGQKFQVLWARRGKRAE
jgi:SAM-dependent MidA family methyltransferase